MFPPQMQYSPQQPPQQPPPASNVETCRDAARGRCTRGRNCRFAHVGGDSDSFDRRPPRRDRDYDYDYDYRPYSPPPFYSPPRGNPYSAAFDSYGGGGGGRYPPPRRPRRRSRSPPRRYNEPDYCRDFINGKCNRGESCRFSHAREICGDFLRGRCSRSDCRFSHDKSEGELCRDFQKGVCNRGDSCRFFHQTGQPCRDFTLGKCTRGANCKFSHDQKSVVKDEKVDEAAKLAAAGDTSVPTTEQAGSGASGSDADAGAGAGTSEQQVDGQVDSQVETPGGEAS